MSKYENEIAAKSPQGFTDLFYSLCSDYAEVKDAYEAAERQHERITGERKYANYESFRGSRLSKAKRKKA